MNTRKINILRDDVIGKIAAGEVVERPASVIKELIENSIDAGANSIEIEIQDAGKALIRIADNGEGMSVDDAKLACQRHATSKLSDIDDLNNIVTLGFRGEALASIAAVSQMDITTRKNTEETGTYLFIEGGILRKIRPAGRTTGTTIEVRNLFFNVPARMKFLKKKAAELSEIVNIVGRFILSYENIEFKLTHSERILFNISGNMGIEDRIRIVLGGDFADHMIGINNKNEGIEIRGYISRPSHTRRDRQAQVFFINGRPVKSKLLFDSVFVSYRSMLERGKYPPVVIFLKVPPSSVDVNVHPAKLEVKFEDEKIVKDMIRRTINAKFEDCRIEHRSADGLFLDKDTNNIDRSNITDKLSENSFQAEFSFQARDNQADSGSDYSKNDSSLKENLSCDSGKQRLPREYYQLKNCYIVKIQNDKIRVIDQHAAHERILYEYFRQVLDGRELEKQNLLFPENVNLSAGDTILMEKMIMDFEKLGFIIEPFGDKTFIIQAVPSMVKKPGIKKVIYDILSDLSEKEISKIDLLDELIKLTSCRAAIKSGDSLNEEEIRGLLSQLDQCKLPFTCPHGRPTIIDIEVDELEKRFRRK